MLDDSFGHIVRTQLVEQVRGPPMCCRGESVEQARGGEQQRAGTHRGGECGVRVYRLQPGADGVVVNQLAGSDPAREHHHIGCAEFVECGVASHAQHPVFGTRLAAAMPDEHHFDRRNALQHFVGSDRVERSKPWEKWNCDQRHACLAPAAISVSAPVSGAGASGRRCPAGRNQSGSQPGGVSGAQSKGPPDGSSTRPPQRTRSSFGR